MIAWQKAQDRTTGAARIIVLLISILLVTGWMVARAIVNISVARAQEKAAIAKQLSEQRQLIIIRANIEAQRRGHNQQYPIPASLMKRPGNGKGLPRAE